MRKRLTKIFLVWLCLFTVWTLYRYFLSLPETVEEFLIKPAIWLGLIIPVVLLFEKRPLSSLGLSGKNFYRNVYIGLGLGTLFALEGVIVNYLKYGKTSFLAPTANTNEFLLLFVMSFATGLTEEIVSRGYFMNRLWEIIRSETIANLMSSLMFTVIHLPIAIFALHYGAFDLVIYLWTIFLLGLADGYIFARTKTIVAPTITHTMWNLSIVLFR